MKPIIPQHNATFTVPDSFGGVLVLSDVHLGAFTTKKNCLVQESVISLLAHAQNQNWFVVINGDLFDYWMEYPDQTYPREFDDILNHLQAVADQQGTIPFLCGNHDNWTKNLLSNLGLTVEKEFLIIRYRSIPFLLTHGDGLAVSDMKLKRKWMNRILRNRFFISFYQRLLPSQHGINLMRWFSSACRKLSEHNDETDQERLNNWAKTILQSDTISTVVTGHDHVPRIKKYSGGVLLNTGDFFRRWTFGLFLGNMIQLRRWNHSQQINELLRSERIPLSNE